MTDLPEFDPPLDPAERDLASELAAERPLPAGEFRGALGRHLAQRDPGYGPRPAHLRPMVALYVGAGAALAALGTLQSTGVL
jgi:hypothetical protein